MSKLKNAFAALVVAAAASIGAGKVQAQTPTAVAFNDNSANKPKTETSKTFVHPNAKALEAEGIYFGTAMDAFRHSRDSVALVPHIAGPESLVKQMIDDARTLRQNIKTYTGGRVDAPVYIIVINGTSIPLMGADALGEEFSVPRNDGGEPDTGWLPSTINDKGAYKAFVAHFVEQLKLRSAAAQTSTQTPADDQSEPRLLAGGG